MRLQRRIFSASLAVAFLLLPLFHLAPPAWASSGQRFALDKESSITLRKVRIFGSFPSRAETLGLVVARADSLKGAAERLCKEAAKLGADGVVVTQVGYLFEKGDEVGLGGVAVRSEGVAPPPR
ncbi:MAG: hypothetical protein AB7T14_00220 [Candidatus Methylacidiphilaceae bacterium]